jgi:predicted transcriptional regulator
VRAVLEILSNNGQLTGQDIANQCSFESRMASAGVIAQLVRAKAIESIPASYRITDMGRSILAASTNGAEEKQPKKSKRKSKKEPQNEPSSGQGEQSP